eukprot:2436064-Pleurochrysis_carterae.AAC.1
MPEAKPQPVPKGRGAKRKPANSANTQHKAQETRQAAATQRRPQQPAIKKTTRFNIIDDDTSDEGDVNVDEENN